MILKCTCEHEGQDKLHGKNQRVHNETNKGQEKQVIWRCTVCQSTKTKQEGK